MTSVWTALLRPAKSASDFHGNTFSSLDVRFSYVNCSEWNVRVQGFGSGAAPGDSATPNVTPGTGVLRGEGGRAPSRGARGGPP